MENIIEVLKKHISRNAPNLGDGDSVLSLLYEAYSENNRLDDAQTKSDFEELYRQMNGMDLREMDRIIDAVCTLCRDHQKSGFIEGVRIGVQLCSELMVDNNRIQRVGDILSPTGK